MRYKNLTIIGTSHIAPESVKKVREIISKKKPDIVAIELDKKRLVGLLDKRKKGVALSDIRKVGLKGFIFALLGAWAEEKLGKKVGVLPGTEMLEAYKTAKEQKLEVALIDQDIEVTLKKLSECLSWKEKFFFISDVIKAVVFKKGIEIDLKKVPSEKIINKLVKQVKKRYPNVYRVLVAERNEVLAKNIFKLMNYSPNKEIVAVVGAGHEKEIVEILNKKKWEF